MPKQVEVGPQLLTEHLYPLSLGFGSEDDHLRAKKLLKSFMRGFAHDKVFTLHFMPPWFGDYMKKTDWLGIYPKPIEKKDGEIITFPKLRLYELRPGRKTQSAS